MKSRSTLSIALIAVSFLAGCSTNTTQWIELPLSEGIYFESVSSLPEGNSNASPQQGNYEIPIAAGEALEYMLAVSSGEGIAYQWTTVISDPQKLTAEFHGHTIREGEEPGTVMIYKSHQVDNERGALVAPFDGIHGWYFNNESDEDIVIRLEVNGFFERYEKDH